MLSKALYPLLLSLSWILQAPAAAAAAATNSTTTTDDDVASSSSSSSSSLALNLTILHMNDHHSHIDEHTLILGPDVIPNHTLSVNTSSIRMYYGGAARQVAAMKQIRNESIASGHEVLTVHAGDAISGTLYFTAYGTAVDSSWMNAAGIFDLFVPGNHDFDGVRVRSYFDSMHRRVVLSSLSIANFPLTDCFFLFCFRCFLLFLLDIG
jgi:5'-nucleotidase / UDP-sugar diphosphatase